MSKLSSFDAIVSQISTVLDGQGLNLLINNAGVATKFTKLGLVKEDQLLENLTVNTVAPIMLTKVKMKTYPTFVTTNENRSYLRI